MKTQMQLNVNWLQIKVILLSLFCSINIFGQDRITALYELESKVTTFLTTHNNDKYIVTITPDDNVSFYTLHSDNSRTILRNKNIPFSYIAREGNKIVKDKHFVLFSDVEIFNYDFINDDVKRYPINNPILPNVSFSVQSREDDGLRFSLNGTNYIYYVQENRLEICNGNLFNKFDNHMIFSESGPDQTHYYYSDNYGIDKRYLWANPNNRIFMVNMYPEYLLTNDSTGNVLKFYYNGEQDTLFNLNKPMSNNVSISVLETETFIATFYATLNDSTELKIYDKTSLNLIQSFKIEFTSLVYKNDHFKQNGESIVFYTQRREMYICNPFQNKMLRIRNVNFSYGQRIFTVDNKLFVFLYELNVLKARLIDVSSFQSLDLQLPSTLKLSYTSVNQWFNHGGKYYYNLVADSDAKQSMLFTIDEGTYDFAEILPEDYYVGIDKSHPLKKYGSLTFLLTNDLYKIFETRYEKVNTQPLETLLYFAKEKYRTQDEGFVYVQKSGKTMEFYFQSSELNRKIFSIDSTLYLQDIVVGTNFAAFVDINRKLYLIDIKSQSIELIDRDLDMIAQVTYLLHDGKNFYYRRFENLMLLEPTSKMKKKIASGRLADKNPMTVMHGKPTFIFEDGISQLNDDQSLVKFKMPLEYIYTPDFRKINEDLFYFIFRSESGYHLYKYEGQDFTKIYGVAGFIDLTNVFDQNIVFRTRTGHSLPDSKIYINADNAVYDPMTKDDVSLSQVFVFNGQNIGVFQTFDSLYFVSFNLDFSTYDILHKQYAPYTVQAHILGTLPNDKILISTGREFLYVDENLKFHNIKDIVPNNVFKNILLTDSIFYFMAIGKPYGNQVYAFNYEDFDRTFINHTMDTNFFPSDLLLYPNPSSSIIYLKTPMNPAYLDNCSYAIYNINGSYVTGCKSILGEAIDVQFLSAGQYFLLLKNENSFTTSKFTVLR